ncbi:hypothetical protein K469DRAFT_399325 [Zopfia rhizophila CBS 207.26]|uniref:Uncharacterized protein n=1 Tax=Zopfia rhizophila CBS 207.26 TaxID=1314779 RepID=A0A6A6DF56_9PEZI|nr:hypothetical protein K469DRAFT_399325 [Zopfia rhizophila CBS 207.26]
MKQMFLLTILLPDFAPRPTLSHTKIYSTSPLRLGDIASPPPCDRCLFQLSAFRHPSWARAIRGNAQSLLKREQAGFYLCYQESNCGDPSYNSLRRDPLCLLKELNRPNIGIGMRNNLLF